MPSAEAGLLLDTHVWYWLVLGEKSGRRWQAAADSAAARGALYVHAVTVWEIAMLERKGRLQLRSEVGDWIRQALSQPGLGLLPLDPDIAIASTRLPGQLPGDPADRVLAASARLRGLRLATADRALCRYARQGHVELEPGGAA